MGIVDHAIETRDAQDAAAVCRQITGVIARAVAPAQRDPVDRLPVRIDPGQEVTFRMREAEARELENELHGCQGGTASIPSFGNRGGPRIPAPAS